METFPQNSFQTYHFHKQNYSGIWMNSRSRRFIKSLQKQEKKIQRQINYDFQASEELNQNQILGKTIDEYSKLLNSMIVTKKQKKKKFTTLDIKLKQINRKISKQNNGKSRIQIFQDQKHDFRSQFLRTEEKISVESEIKNELQQEITRTKKSLNLLKGDFNHLVRRNESTSLIQSKTSKVEIVAHDQFEKVSMAFFKDKDELKIRGEMQKRFKRNLRNVSMLQNSALKKFRSNYVEMLLKKRQLNDRLNHIQKVSSLINKSRNIQKIKDEKNQWVMDLYKCFAKLFILINEANRIEQRSQILEYINYPTLEEVSTENLINYQRIFVTEYQRMNKEIQKKTIIFDLETKKHNQLMMKLESLNDQIKNERQRCCQEVQITFKITKQQKEKYKQKLKKLFKTFKILFIFLEFVQKYVKNSPHQKQKSRPRTIQNTSQFFVQKDSSKNASSFQNIHMKNVSIQKTKQNHSPFRKSEVHKNYVSELLTIYQILEGNKYDENLDLIKNDIYYHLQNDMKKWFQIIRQKHIKKNQLQVPLPKKQQKFQNYQKPRRSTSRLRQSRISVFILPKTMKQLQDDQKIQIIEEDKFHNQMHKLFELKKRQNSVKQHRTLNSFHVWQRKNNLKSKNQLNKKQQDFSYCSDLINQQKLKHHTEHLDCKKPKRFYLLKKVDRDYYMMLKSTLKMQIQNTKKNYIFSKDFKRDKYSPRNQILEQRRFQCNFSIAFAKNSSQALKKTYTQTKKNAFCRHSNFQKRISKLNDVKCSEKQINSLNVSNERLSLSIQKQQIQSKENNKRQMKVSRLLILRKRQKQDLKEIINLI